MFNSILYNPKNPICFTRNSSSFLTCDIYFYFASCAWGIDLLFNIMDKCHQWFHLSLWWEPTVILTIWQSSRRRSDFWVSSFNIFGLCWDLSALCNPRKTAHYILKSLNQQEGKFWWRKKVFEGQEMSLSIKGTICKKMRCNHQKQMSVVSGAPPPRLAFCPWGHLETSGFASYRSAWVSNSYTLWHCISENPAFDFYKKQHGSHKQHGETRWKILWGPYFFAEKRVFHPPRVLVQSQQSAVSWILMVVL